MSRVQQLSGRLNLRKNVVFAAGEFLVNTILLFVGYRLLIRQGGLEAVGIWSTLYAWTNLIRMGDAGVAGAAVRFLALWDVECEQRRLREYGETALLTNIAQFGVLAAAAYVLLSKFMIEIVGAAHISVASEVLPWMLVGFFLINVGGATLGMLQGLHLGYRRSQLSVAGTIIQLSCVIALVPSYGLRGLAIAQVAQHGAVTLCGWYLIRLKLGSGLLPSYFSRVAFKDMLGYSVKAQLVNITNGLLEPVSKMLIAHFGGMATQGMYELAYKTILLPRNLVVAGVSATTPSMANLFKHDPKQLKVLYNRAISICSKLMALACVAIVLLAPVPSYMFLGRIDPVYWAYVAILAVGFFGSVAASPAYVIGMASGKMKFNLLTTAASLVGLLALGYGMGETLGAMGLVSLFALAIGSSGAALYFMNRSIVDSAAATDKDSKSYVKGER